MSEEADEPSEREIDDAYAAAVDTLRGLVRLESALAAEKLRQVAVLVAVAEAAGRAELAVGPRVPGQPFVLRYQPAEVSTTAMSSANSRPPATGRNQAGEVRLFTANTLTTRAP